MTKSKPELCIVIPLHNEAPHLMETVGRITSVVDTVGCAYQLLLVDDGSSDNTWGVIKELSDSSDNVKAIQLSRSFGKELAICAGLERANASSVLVMDGDLQHPPELIPEMYHTWKVEGYEVVEACKEKRGKEALHIGYGARVYYSLFDRLSGFELQGASDFKLLDEKVLDAWMSMTERNVFFRGMSAWVGFKRKKISFAVPDGVKRDTKWSTWKLTNLAVQSITAFSSLPLHLITLMSGLFFLFALGLGLLALYYKLTGVAVTGFSTVIILQLIIGSLIMAGLGIVGEYIARIYDEVKDRPRYIVREEL